MSFDYSFVNKQPVNFLQINKVLEKAYKSIKSAEATIKVEPESCFTLAYESMLKTSLALMLSRGYRPKMQLGHHKTLVSFAQIVLGNKFSGITSTYDKMRRKRNKLIYDIASVSTTEAKESLKIAEKYFVIVEKKIAEENPQKNLWTPN